MENFMNFDFLSMTFKINSDNLKFLLVQSTKSQKYSNKLYNYRMHKKRCSELNSQFDKSELNTRNLANLTHDFWYELN